MKVFLVGLAGSGKTTLGKELATVLDVDFVDLDVVIKQHAQMTIPEIFEQKGETYFRDIESQLLRETIQNNDNIVMSTGGGAPCFRQNMEFIVQNGVSIFLNVPLKTLAKRVMDDGIANRPLYKGLTKEALLSKIQGQFDERYPFYKKSHITLEGDTLSVHDIIAQIKKMPR